MKVFTLQYEQRRTTPAHIWNMVSLHRMHLFGYLRLRRCNISWLLTIDDITARIHKIYAFTDIGLKEKHHEKDTRGSETNHKFMTFNILGVQWVCVVCIFYVIASAPICGMWWSECVCVCASIDVGIAGFERKSIRMRMVRIEFQLECPEMTYRCIKRWNQSLCEKRPSDTQPRHWTRRPAPTRILFSHLD